MNYATYVEPIAMRDESESVPDFMFRARAILAERGGGRLAWDDSEEVEWVDPAPEAVTITGGLEPDASGNFAMVGNTLVERGDGELTEAFRARARARAFGLGKSIVFGGLRHMPTDDSSNEI